MREFVVITTVRCETLEQAEIIANERWGYDEQYDDDNGEEFEYRIDTIEVLEVDESNED